MKGLWKKSYKPLQTIYFEEDIKIPSRNENIRSSEGKGT